MIDDVIVTPLRQIHNEFGKVMHMMKEDFHVFQRFGEVYFSIIYPNSIKGWNRHTKMTINLAVPIGNVHLVLFDGRENSGTFGQIQHLFLGADNYQLVTIPPLIWTSFKSLGMQTAMIANCATHLHSPNEVEKLDIKNNTIPYDWSS